jgi:predicted ATPase
MKRMIPSTTYLPLLLIENPEAHLHPKGQTMMGRFLASAASCGVQCIIETHSEHVLNGVRLAIKEGLLKPDAAVGYFFEYSFSSEMSTVQPIFFDEHGACDCWPENFFDESEKSLMELL